MSRVPLGHYGMGLTLEEHEHGCVLGNVHDDRFYLPYPALEALVEWWTKVPEKPPLDLATLADIVSPPEDGVTRG